ncbi:MAG: hypothetical protein JJU06_22285 [Ectothiorhodospiraceae bacterium]|nr:hypothetical protein [Ectothiorhodospiraceae bacterium]MCH8506796.1 hypothetical protein [Ectothiorhodospiraceae bacterium]
MASILMRDLAAAGELDRRATLSVRGGALVQYVTPYLTSMDLSKINTQVQVAVVNNIAVAPLGGVGAFDLTGGVGQAQLA